MKLFDSPKKCSNCQLPGTAELYITNKTSNYISKPLCPKCILYEARKTPTYMGYESISEEIKNIKKMIEIIDKTNLNFSNMKENERQLLSNIIDEEWDKITLFRIKLSQFVVNEVTKKYEEYRTKLESIVDSVISNKEVIIIENHIRSISNKIENLKKNLSIFQNTNEKNVIYEAMINSDKLNGIKYYEIFQKNSIDYNKLLKRYNRIESEKLHLEKSLVGFSFFISGRISEMLEFRQYAEKYLLKQNAKVVLSENLADPSIPKKACLEWVRNQDFYIGILGPSYGSLTNKNISVTEEEADEAFDNSKTRLIFVQESKNREDRQQKLIDKFKGWDDNDYSLVYVNFKDIDEFKNKFKDSIINLISKGIKKVLDENKKK